MAGPVSEQAAYYPYWNRVLLAAFVWAGLVLGLLMAIVWRLWRG